MDIRKVKKLIELLEDSNLSEMEIQEGEESIRLSRSAPMVASVTHPTPVAVTSTPVNAEAPSAVDNGPAEEIDTINSPMVGTFYSAAKPGDPDFVKEGDTVAVGDVLCIIEAMKIFNQIESDRAGKVVSMLKSSGNPVEYGEPLFVIQ